MKRYLVFAYDAYYPAGGWCDFEKAFTDREDAFAYAETLETRFSGGVEVIDLETECDIYVYRSDRAKP